MSRQHAVCITYTGHEEITQERQRNSANQGRRLPSYAEIMHKALGYDQHAEGFMSHTYRAGAKYENDKRALNKEGGNYAEIRRLRRELTSANRVFSAWILQGQVYGSPDMLHCWSLYHPVPKLYLSTSHSKVIPLNWNISFLPYLTRSVLHF